jgi:Tol biopolymer transport system component
MKKIVLILFILILSGCTQKLNNVKIVFMSKADSQQGELYLYNTTNENIIRLTNNNRHENNPALSRKGRYVAFHAGDINNMLTWEIHYIDLQTMQEYQVTNNSLIDGHPDWSPDNQQIVYSSFQDSQGNPAGVGDIFIINKNGSKIKRLTNNEHENNDPEWSLDGTKIVFKSTRRKNETFQDEIYIMNINGSDVKRLTTTNEWNSDHDPSWSMDNENIVFTRFQGRTPWINLVNISFFQNNYDLFTPWNCFKVDLNGNIEQLTFSKHLNVLPVYSPTKEGIMYIEYEPIFLNNIISGFYHKLILINGTKKTIIFDNKIHTPTLEYYDW